MKKLLISLIVSVMLPAQMAFAESLTFGMKAEISSADPHVLFGPNRNIGKQVYEPLFVTDPKQNPMMGIAKRFTVISPTEFEVEIRPDVQFHDGSLVTAQDVKFSIDRAYNLKASRTFKTYIKNVKDVVVVNDTVLRVKTSKPTAILKNNLATISILSKKAAEGATEEDFKSGKAAIGAGPYKWKSWAKGNKVELVAHENYYGGKPQFDSVTVKFIKDDSGRVAALLSGDVDVIDEVPPQVVQTLNKKDMNVEYTPSYMFNYIGVDQHRDVSQYVTGINGEQIKNPFLDVRVRQAVSMLLNREQISKRIMGGLSTPAGQYMSKGMSGYVDGLDPVKHNPEKAKKLLAEAGYPNGFKLTIHCTNDRYMNDAKVCEAMGQQLSAGGIPTKVQTFPRSVFFKRASRGGKNGEPEFSFFMVGFGSGSGVVDAALTALVSTHNKEAGTGANNRARYSNPTVDQLASEASQETDATKRKNLLDAAIIVSITEGGVIPIHYLGATWASSAKYKVTPYADTFTMFEKIVKVK